MTSTDEGLSLIEVLVALLMLSIVSISAAVIFVGSLKTTTDQSVTQRAVAVATRALETTSSVPVSQLVKGRSQTAVVDLLAEPRVVAVTGQDLPGPQMDAETGLATFDPVADATSVPVVPIQSTEQLDGMTYDLRTIINQCWLHTTGGGAKVCDFTQGTDGRRIYRATVNVVWRQPDCGRKCSYSVSSLIDQRDDPVFQLAQSVPIVAAVSPSASAVTSTKNIVISGVKFQNGARLELQSGGGSITNVAQAITTATTQITATWTAGPTVGGYTLTVVNPDGGRAGFQLAVTAPTAVNDCMSTRTRTNSGGDFEYDLFFNDNDDPTTGATQAFSNVVSTGTLNGSIASGTSSGKRFLRVTVTPSSSGTVTVDYTNTIGGLTSPNAQAAFKINSGSC